MREKFLNFFLGILPLIIFLLLWEFVLATSPKALFLFASPSLVFKALVENMGNGILITDLLITAKETFFGLLLGNLVGITIGLSLWYSKQVAIIAKPYIIAISSVPIFAVAPMMIIWFGTDLMAKVMMAAISTVTIAITQSYEGASNVDNHQVKLLKSFGANKNQIFKKLVIPSSIVWLFNSFKLNVTFALLGSFIGEFVSSESGLGHRILKAGGLYNIPLVLAAIFCLILLAFFFTLLIYLIEKYFFNWKEK